MEETQKERERERLAPVLLSICLILDSVRLLGSHKGVGKHWKRKVATWRRTAVHVVQTHHDSFGSCQEYVCKHIPKHVKSYQHTTRYISTYRKMFVNTVGGSWEWCSTLAGSWLAKEEGCSLHGETLSWVSRSLPAQLGEDLMGHFLFALDLFSTFVGFH